MIRSSLTTILVLSLVIPGPGARPVGAEQEPAAESTLPGADAQDVAHVPAIDLRAKGHEKKRYVLIGLDEEAKPPKKGYGLIVILPGGSGSIDFHAFCKRIHDNAVPEDFLTLQLVAPAWTEWSAENLVWPTEKRHYKDAEFGTEEHLIDAVAEVKKRVKVDESRIYALAWSSAGPATYATTLHKDNPLAGAFVAMSVFQPDKLPSLKRAKGQRYYILHSPEDFIPIRDAELARDELAEHKAKTTLVTYEGGHGWRGDIYGTMTKGIAWLEESGKKKR